MTPKTFLPVIGLMFFLMTSLTLVRPATANPFGEAFGAISNYSRMFNPGRSYRATQRRRAIRRRIARRRYALRRRYYARRRRGAIRARYRNARARSIRQAQVRRKRHVRKRARLVRSRQVKREQARVVQRRIVRRQQARQQKVRQNVARKRLARIRQQQVASRRIAHKKKQILARQVARSKRIALASVKIASKRPMTPRRKPKVIRRHKPKKAVHLVQASHKPKLLEQARSGLTYGVQGKVPGLNRVGKKGVQLALSRAGFYDGAADGLFGRQTRSAIRDYQKSLGQNRTGRLDSIQLSSLLQAVSKTEKSGNSYLPQSDQKSHRQKKIKKQAKILAERAQLPVNNEVIFEPKKISFMKPSAPRKAKPFVAVKPKELEQQASLKMNPRKNGDRLFALPKPDDAKKVGTPPIDPKAAKQVDYVHTLGRTRHGEPLWVVKCMDKKQLRLYFWRDKQWWVRGKDGGSVGFSEYGSGGIKNLAGKVCTL